MGKLSALYPESVFTAFEELCGIPHGSYHIDAISDYLKNFAEKRGFCCIQDAGKNIIVRVPATAGYENEPVLILQGHMDMVAVHDDPSVDMTKHILELDYDRDWVFAKNSSLGGDDGIAVAMMMAIMDDPAIPHPELELLITTNEEVGMDGAVGLDASLLKGKRLLNLDSEDEGIFTVGCAGGVRVVAEYCLEHAEEAAEGYRVEVCVRGGQGGHSGQMIGLGRGNANKILGRVLYRLNRECAAVLEEIHGGTAANAIPGEAQMSLILPAEQLEKGLKLLEELNAAIRHEYHGKDDELSLDWEGGKECNAQLVKGRFSVETTAGLAGLLIAEPDGVQAMSGAVKGLVETSLNLGVLKTQEDTVSAVFELRSMIGTAAEALRDRVALIAERFGAGVQISSSYPEWEYKEKSELRDRMVRVFREMYGKEPVVEVIHAGLECGVLAKKIDGFDAVSIGPDMQDIHTTRERLNIASVGRCWEYLLEVLKRK